MSLLRQRRRHIGKRSRSSLLRLRWSHMLMWTRLMLKLLVSARLLLAMMLSSLARVEILNFPCLAPRQWGTTFLVVGAFKFHVIRYRRWTVIPMSSTPFLIASCSVGLLFLNLTFFILPTFLTWLSTINSL